MAVLFRYEVCEDHGCKTGRFEIERVVIDSEVFKKDVDGAREKMYGNMKNDGDSFGRE